MIALREDDPGAPHVAALLAFHLVDAHSDTPPGFRHALDANGLCAPGITFWTAWRDGELAGMAALKALDGDKGGEVKSMRVASDHLRRGIGRALLARIVGTARARGYRWLKLETGTSPSFAAANALYDAAGFVDCDAFGGYPPSEHNRFMTLNL